MARPLRKLQSRAGRRGPASPHRHGPVLTSLTMAPGSDRRSDPPAKGSRGEDYPPRRAGGDLSRQALHPPARLPQHILYINVKVMKDAGLPTRTDARGPRRAKTSGGDGQPVRRRHLRLRHRDRRPGRYTGKFITCSGRTGRTSTRPISRGPAGRPGRARGGRVLGAH